MALLIDDVGVAAYRAVSVRRLRTAYSGSCLRIARTLDSTEQDIGFVGDYLDEAALLAFVGTGGGDHGFVVTWYDQSGNGRNWTSTGTHLVSAGVLNKRNGKAAIFNDTATGLGGAGTLGLPWTVLAVWADTNMNSDSFLVQYGNSCIWYCPLNGKQHISRNAVASLWDSTTTITNDAMFAGGCRIDGDGGTNTASDYKFFLNGVADGSSTTTQAFNDASANQLLSSNQTVQEIVEWDVALSDLQALSGSTNQNAYFIASVGPSGTLAATEAIDVAAFVVAVGTSGALAVTETGDVAAFTGIVSVLGTLAVTEGQDVASFVGAVPVGALIAVEAQDTAAFAGAVSVSGTLSAVEAADDAAFAGSFASTVTGTLAAVEASDIAAFSVTVPIPANSAVLSAIEDSDRAQFQTHIGVYKIIHANSYIGVSQIPGNLVRVLWTKVYSPTALFGEYCADIGHLQLQRSWVDTSSNEYQRMLDELNDANVEVARINSAEQRSIADALVYRMHTLQLAFDGVGVDYYRMYINYSPNIPKSPPLNPRNLNGANL